MRRFELDDTAPGGGPTRPLGELFRELSAGAAVLIRQEMALARAEISRSVRALARDVGRTAAWGLVAVVGGLVLVAFLVVGLGDLLDSYALAMLLVGLLFAGAGAFMALRGLRRLRTAPVRPGETVETLRDTGAWARAEAAGLRSALAGRSGGADGSGRGGAAAPPAGNRIAAHVAALGGDGSGGGAPPRRPAGEGGAGGGAGAGTASAGSLPKRVWAEFQADDVAGQAARVAYYFFLSLPPALMALFALTGLFGGPEVATRISGELRGALPAEAAGLVDDFVAQVVLEEKPGLLSLGLLLALWSASNVFGAMGDTLNLAYGVKETRSWVRRKALALGTLLAVAVLFLAGSTALLAGPAISDALGLGEVGRTAWGILQWPLAFGLIAAAFWIVYYVLPNKDQSRCRATLFRASAVAAGLWLAATFLFRIYVANFGSYGATYGFIGAVIVLLLWMYVTSLVVLLGGEIAAEMEEGR